MSSIKSDRLDFERLLNGIDPVDDMGVAPNKPSPSVVSKPSLDVVDNTSPAEIMNAKAFEFDFEGIRKGIRKRCRKMVLNIVNHVLPNDIIDLEYIKDKIEQDTETLTVLYMQVEINTIMQKTLVESVAKGQIAPRMFEVFNQATDTVLSINKQIVDTEQRIRKTYLDLKFEAREKISDDLALGVSQNGPASGNMISGPNVTDSGKGVLVTNTTDLINGVKKLHLENMKSAQYEIKE